MTTAPPLPAPPVHIPRRRRALRGVGGFLRTTPGRLGLLASMLVAAAVAYGVAGAMTIQQQSAALHELSTSSESLSVAAQQLYRSLSDADATAAGAFLSGGIEPPAGRDRYQSDLTAASLALAAANQRSADEPALVGPLQTLSTELPVYAGLVEAARADNRLGLPVGSAYLREASGLMRGRLLPAAQQLYTVQSERVMAAENRVGAFPVPALLLGLLTLLALVVAQSYLARKTNRLFNTGLLVAAAAVVASLLWVTLAAGTASRHIQLSRDQGSMQADVLARARIAALEARGDETLGLAGHGEARSYEEHFGAVTARLAGPDGLLRQARARAVTPEVRTAVGSAIGDTTVWLSAHARVRALYDSGDYNGAVQAAIGPLETSSGVAFGRVDATLDQAIRSATASFDGQVAAAERALAGVPVGIGLLAAVAGVSSVFGLWQRMKEYR
jgi:hypothetical protein